MERYNKWFFTNITNYLINGVYNLNYLVYKMELILIILGLVIICILIITNMKKYSYR